MKNYEELKQKIIKAVPEIMNLEFGCVINRRCGMYSNGIIIGQDNGTYYVLYDSVSGRIECVFDIQKEETIGRDITLSDVLMALNKKGIDFEFDGYRLFVLESCVNLKYNDSEDTYIVISIELGKPLHEQSEETINFLNKIL